MCPAPTGSQHHLPRVSLLPIGAASPAVLAAPASSAAAATADAGAGTADAGPLASDAQHASALALSAASAPLAPASSAARAAVPSTPPHMPFVAHTAAVCSGSLPAGSAASVPAAAAVPQHERGSTAAAAAAATAGGSGGGMWGPGWQSQLQCLGLLRVTWRRWAGEGVWGGEGGGGGGGGQSHLQLLQGVEDEVEHGAAPTREVGTHVAALVHARATHLVHP